MNVLEYFVILHITYEALHIHANTCYAGESVYFCCAQSDIQLTALPKMPAIKTKLSHVCQMLVYQCYGIIY